MKKVIVFVIMAIVVICSCFAQNASTERLFLGTWTDNKNFTWVFNENGTFNFNNDSNGRYTSTQLAFSNGTIFNISVSSNGRTMILSQHNSNIGLLLIKN